MLSATRHLLRPFEHKQKQILRLPQIGVPSDAPNKFLIAPQLVHSLATYPLRLAWRLGKSAARPEF